MTDRRLRQIQQRIERIKSELGQIGPMRPGSLSRQYKQPRSRSGAYHQLSYTRDMKSRTEYVARDRLQQVRQQIRAYQRFRSLSDEWVKLGIEQCQLLLRSVGNYSRTR
jgi:hypothetical protein